MWMRFVTDSRAVDSMLNTLFRVRHGTPGRPGPASCQTAPYGLALRAPPSASPGGRRNDPQAVTVLPGT